MKREDRVELVRTVFSFLFMLLLMTLMGWSVIDWPGEPPAPRLTKEEIYMDALRKMEARDERYTKELEKWIIRDDPKQGEKQVKR